MLNKYQLADWFYFFTRDKIDYDEYEKIYWLGLDKYIESLPYNTNKLEAPHG